MELRRRTLKTNINNATESSEMAVSSHDAPTNSSSRESSVAENSSLERFEREKSKSNEGKITTESSSKGRSSLFRKFRTYLSSLVKGTSVKQSDENSSQEQSDASRATGDAETPKRALFEDNWLQTSEVELSSTPQVLTSHYAKDWQEQSKEDQVISEPQQVSIQTAIREEESYDDYKPSSELEREESENSMMLTQSLRTPANSECKETSMERNYLLNSAKSEAKGRTRKYTRGSARKQLQETTQKPTISKAKTTRRTSSTSQKEPQVLGDQLSQALSEDFSETISYQELRSLCKRLGIKATGKKTQLIGKIRSYVKSQETTSEASVSHMEKSSVQDKVEKNREREKEARETTVSSKLKRDSREDRNKEVSGKTVGNSIYSVETIALARAVLQHLQSQQRTISVEEYQLYQNILKNAVQKPSSQAFISDYATDTVGGPSRVRKRMRTPPLALKPRQSNHPLIAMKAVEISIGEEVESFSTQQSLQPSLKRQRIYSMDVLPFEEAEESSPKRSQKTTPVPVRPSASKHTETTGSGLTPVDVVRTFIGSTSGVYDKDHSISKQAEIDQGVSIAGSAFTTPIVSKSIPQSTFSYRKETASENRESRKQDTPQTQLLFSNKNDLTKAADTSSFKKFWETGKERVYDFRKNLSPTPAKVSASDTARKILETLERIAGNSAERKKPPPVTLDSLRKRHRIGENNRTPSENKTSHQLNDRSLEVRELNTCEDTRQSNDSINKSKTGSHSEHASRNQEYTKEFSVDLAKDLFAKHIDASSKKELKSEVEDKATCIEPSQSDTRPVHASSSDQQQVEVQESSSQYFPIMSSVTKRLMSDRDAESIISHSFTKANDNNVDWKLQEESIKKDSKDIQEGDRDTKDSHTDPLKPNYNEHSKSLINSQLIGNDSSPEMNEVLPTNEQNRSEVEQEATKKKDNASTEMNASESQNDEIFENRFEHKNLIEEPVKSTFEEKKDDEASCVIDSEKKAVAEQEMNETVPSTNNDSVVIPSSKNVSQTWTVQENIPRKPNSFQTNTFSPSSNQNNLMQSSSASFIGSTIGDAFTANHSQIDNGLTRETFSGGSVGFGVTQSMPIANISTSDAAQSKVGQSYPSLFSNPTQTTSFMGTSVSSDIFTSSTTFPTATPPNSIFQTPFSTSSFSGALQSFSQSSNLFASNQQSFPAFSNQFVSSGFSTAPPSVASSFSSSGLQGVSATTSSNIFSKPSPFSQGSAPASSLFSASVPAFTASAFSSAVANPFSTVSPFTFSNSSSSFVFGSTPAFASSSDFQLNTSPFSTSQPTFPQSSSGMENNPFTAPFQFGSNMPLFSSGASNIQFTSSFAIGSQNTSTTSGRKMVRARRLRQ